MALSAKQVEEVSESDPEMVSLRQYILRRDGLQCRMSAYFCVRQSYLAWHSNCHTGGSKGPGPTSCS